MASALTGSGTLSAKSSIESCIRELYRHHIAYLEGYPEQAQDENKGMVSPIETNNEISAIEATSANIPDNRSESIGEPGPSVNEEPIEPTPTFITQNNPNSGLPLPLHVNTERFPEYYRSCENRDARQNRQVEESYKIAISKICDEVISFRQIDSLATAPLPFTMTGDEDTINASTLTNVSETPKIESPPTPASQLNTHHAGVGSDSIPLVAEERKKSTIEHMRNMTSSEHMSLTTKTRFIDMSNTVLRLELLFFRRHATPMDPVLGLTKDEVKEVMHHLEELKKCIGIVDHILQQELTWARRVEYSVKQIAEDTQYNVVTRFRNMTELILKYVLPLSHSLTKAKQKQTQLTPTLISHLNKPRPSERDLLTVFLDFFDAHIYTDFMNDYQRQLPVKENWNPVRVEMTRALIAVWDLINRAIESYDAIIRVTVDIKERYTEPHYREMQETPQAWRSAMLAHHIEGERERQRQAAQRAEARKIAYEQAKEEKRRDEEKKKKEEEEAKTVVGVKDYVPFTAEMDPTVKVRDFAYEALAKAEQSAVSGSKDDEESDDGWVF
ncbi:similar to An07g02040 [Aspergillus luchuensis IFO 4308]|nr:similar to An07g02040 [Aspergillus luchuensis IFO 4308]